MSLSISSYNQPQQATQFPVCYLPPTARPAPGFNPGQAFAQPFPGMLPSMLNQSSPQSFMSSLQSVFGMVQQVMASVERVVSMVSNLATSLLGGIQPTAGGQVPGVPTIGITNATSVAVPAAAPEASQEKTSTWDRIANIGSAIMSVVGMFTGGGAGGLLGSLGGLFKGGAGKIVDIVKKGISFFR